MVLRASRVCRLEIDLLVEILAHVSDVRIASQPVKGEATMHLIAWPSYAHPISENLDMRCMLRPLGLHRLGWQICKCRTGAQELGLQSGPAYPRSTRAAVILTLGLIGPGK
jgi:hypothetical protein